MLNYKILKSLSEELDNILTENDKLRLENSILKMTNKIQRMELDGETGLFYRALFTIKEHNKRETGRYLTDHRNGLHRFIYLWEEAARDLSNGMSFDEVVRIYGNKKQ